MNKTFIMPLIFVFVMKNLSFAQHSLKFPEYKQSKEIPSEINDKFAVAISQNRSITSGEGEWSLLNRKIRDYLNSDLIGGTIINDMPQMNKVVINNEVFGVGSYLEFPDESGKLISPVPDVRIFVRRITKDHIDFGFIRQQQHYVPQVVSECFDDNIEVIID